MFFLYVQQNYLKFVCTTLTYVTCWSSTRDTEGQFTPFHFGIATFTSERKTRLRDRYRPMMLCGILKPGHVTTAAPRRKMSLTDRKMEAVLSAAVALCFLLTPGETTIDNNDSVFVRKDFPETNIT